MVEHNNNQEYLESLQLKVSPAAQKYIATCYPLPDRPGINECTIWKHKLIKSIQDNKPVSIKLKDLILPFPHLAKLLAQGYFETHSLLEYFEGLGEGSHNLNLYKFGISADKAGKKVPENMAEEITKKISGVFDHTITCSAKPADLVAHTLWTFGSTVEVPFDPEYFGKPVRSRYALVHGISEKGHVPVRELTSEEFGLYADWFETRQRSKDNPFKRFSYPK